MAPRSPARRRVLALSVALPVLSARSATAAGIPALVSSAKPSIVAIGVHAPLQNPRFRFLGSGFAVGNGRRIATCAHLVPALDPSINESIAIAVPIAGNARIHQARLVALDRDTDLAILEFDGPPLPVLPLGTPTDIHEGGDVLVIGFPIGNVLGLYPASHRGLIAAVTPMSIPVTNAGALRAQSLQAMRGGPIELLQLDVTAFPGNSGSPLISADSGRVVGVISMGLAKATRESAIENPTGISYAVSVRYLAQMLGAL